MEKLHLATTVEISFPVLILILIVISLLIYLFVAMFIPERFV